MKRLFFRLPLALTLAISPSSAFFPKRANADGLTPALCLALLTDVSSSVSGMKSAIDPPGNYGLQRDGTADALIDPQILPRFMQSGGGVIGYMEFASTSVVMVPFQWLRTEVDVRAFSQRIRESRRSSIHGGTSISEGVMGAMREMEKHCPPGARRVIDVSGDGRNNTGAPITDVRDQAEARRYTINGLPILADELDILARYENEVITQGREFPNGDYQPPGFAILASSYETFAEAMRKKLFSELIGERYHESQTPNNTFAASQPRPPAPSWPVRGLPVRLVAAEMRVLGR